MRMFLRTMLIVSFALCTVGAVLADGPRGAGLPDQCLGGFDAIVDVFSTQLDRAAATNAARPDFIESQRQLLARLVAWRASCLGAPATAAQPGSQVVHTVEGVRFAMRYAPAATYPHTANRILTVDNPFWIAETEVTYGLWYAVRTWAEANGYVFASPGSAGTNGQPGAPPGAGANQPVVRINFRDTIIWCNALSEYLGYQPVYRPAIAGRNPEEVLRDATKTSDFLGTRLQQIASDGFRLPDSPEWYLAARYWGGRQVPLSTEYPAGSGQFWANTNSASGMVADRINAAAVDPLAWYNRNSGAVTQDVGGKQPNGLGLFDMNGNVWDWVYNSSGSGRAILGGSVESGTNEMTVTASANALYERKDVGFRLVRPAD
jgi:formylglycine-generating enzyme required for sulfatase activity